MYSIILFDYITPHRMHYASATFNGESFKFCFSQFLEKNNRKRKMCFSSGKKFATCENVWKLFLKHARRSGQVFRGELIDSAMVLTFFAKTSLVAAETMERSSSNMEIFT